MELPVVESNNIRWVKTWRSK